MVVVCDAGDLPVQVLSFGFGNWVLKAEWLSGVKLYIGGIGLRFLTFFSDFKKTWLYVFLSCCTRFLEHWLLPITTTIQNLDFSAFSSQQKALTLTGVLFLQLLNARLPKYATGSDVAGFGWVGHRTPNDSGRLNKITWDPCLPCLGAWLLRRRQV